LVYEESITALEGIGSSEALESLLDLLPKYYYNEIIIGSRFKSILVRIDDETIVPPLIELSNKRLKEVGFIWKTSISH